ncbi:hypothetical protein ASZ90_007881 [hydrocarbon metagenome]|uniref:Uncharacterized protein n=1 Tax=hydrocarbon metagenome TaxID=938273 RepID=A0A0W8FN37_9ZZZZ
MTKTGTMIVPPPMPINPLKKPDNIPNKIYIKPKDVVILLFFHRQLNS